jgi:AraC-like DNA-binding protein
MLEHQSSLKFILAEKKGLSHERLAGMINLDICENLSLPQLADKAGMSVSTFKREFKKTFNESVKKWLLRKRLDRAYYLLISSEKSIKEISLDCGFTDSSHFIRVFKQVYGKPPGSFARKTAA